MQEAQPLLVPLLEILEITQFFHLLPQLVAGVVAKILLLHNQLQVAQVVVVLVLAAVLVMQALVVEVKEITVGLVTDKALNLAQAVVVEVQEQQAVVAVRAQVAQVEQEQQIQSLAHR